jgi:hypothetical protein
MTRSTTTIIILDMKVADTSEAAHNKTWAPQQHLRERAGDADTKCCAAVDVTTQVEDPFTRGSEATTERLGTYTISVLGSFRTQDQRPRLLPVGLTTEPHPSPLDTAVTNMPTQLTNEKMLNI